MQACPSPLLVTTLIAEAAERPWSAENRLVAIWNSCTASWARFCSGPPTTSSLLSVPSIVMLPPRPSCPADEIATLLVFVGSKFGRRRLPGAEERELEEVAAVQGQVARSRSTRSHRRRSHSSDRASAPVASTVTTSALPVTSRVASRVTPAAHLHVHAREAPARRSPRLDGDPVGSGAEAWKRSSRSTPVVASRTMPVPSRVAFTWAPATGAWEASVTRPTSTAVAESCAVATVVNPARARVATAKVMADLEVTVNGPPRGTERSQELLSKARAHARRLGFPHFEGFFRASDP